jgi:aryl-alcohol dehydrogenase-like predicted oxidoreductase
LQPHYNLVHRDEFERELGEVCRVTTWGDPVQPVRWRFHRQIPQGEPDIESERFAAPSAISTIGIGHCSKRWRPSAQKKVGIRSQLALAWLLSDPLVTSPIIGPRSPEQLKDNLGAAGLRLTPEEKILLDEASEWREPRS